LNSRAVRSSSMSGRPKRRPSLPEPSPARDATPEGASSGRKKSPRAASQGTGTGTPEQAQHNTRSRSRGRGGSQGAEQNGRRGPGRKRKAPTATDLLETVCPWSPLTVHPREAEVHTLGDVQLGVDTVKRLRQTVANYKESLLGQLEGLHGKRRLELQRLDPEFKVRWAMPVALRHVHG
jgi:hypothetical protein